METSHSLCNEPPTAKERNRGMEGKKRWGGDRKKIALTCLWQPSSAEEFSRQFLWCPGGDAAQHRHEGLFACLSHFACQSSSSLWIPSSSRPAPLFIPPFPPSLPLSLFWLIPNLLICHLPLSFLLPLPHPKSLPLSLSPSPNPL